MALLSQGMKVPHADFFGPGDEKLESITTIVCSFKVYCPLCTLSSIKPDMISLWCKISVQKCVASLLTFSPSPPPRPPQIYILLTQTDPTLVTDVRVSLFCQFGRVTVVANT